MGPTPTASPSATSTATASPTPTATATATPCQVTYTTATTTGTITAGGTDIGNHCDDCTTEINLPFPVNVYGTPTVQWRLSGRTATCTCDGPNTQAVLLHAVRAGGSGGQGGPFLNTLFPYYDDLRHR